mmetsp:Transcript_29222/g.64863  ORF Transcript_29222/g.64863 Transcript_29222/m.64863 type:complete len:223 (-) Transcript_29222:534-1202(-)
MRGSLREEVAEGCSGPGPRWGPLWLLPRLLRKPEGAMVQETLWAVRWARLRWRCMSSCMSDSIFCSASSSCAACTAKWFPFALSDKPSLILLSLSEVCSCLTLAISIIFRRSSMALSILPRALSTSAASCRWSLLQVPRLTACLAPSRPFTRLLRIDSSVALLPSSLRVMENIPRSPSSIFAACGGRPPGFEERLNSSFDPLPAASLMRYCWSLKGSLRTAA